MTDETTIVSFSFRQNYKNCSKVVKVVVYKNLILIKLNYAEQSSEIE